MNQEDIYNDLFECAVKWQESCDKLKEIEKWEQSEFDRLVVEKSEIWIQLRNQHNIVTEFDDNDPDLHPRHPEYDSIRTQVQESKKAIDRLILAIKNMNEYQPDSPGYYNALQDFIIQRNKQSSK